MQSLLVDNGSAKKAEQDENDWTFATADTRQMTHGLHPYPARMVPQVVERLIQKYANHDGKDRCLDCFCGSATVLVESKLSKIPSIGIDSNPLAVLISKVKVTPISKEKLEPYAERLYRSIGKDIENKEKVEIPKIKNLDHWFKPSVSRQLAIVKENIYGIRDEDIRDFFKVCLSLTIRKVSNIRPGEFKLYRLAEEKLKTHKPQVLDTFTDVVNSNIIMMDKFEREVDKSVSSIVIKGDTRKLLELDPQKIYEGCSTLLITSPPYGDSHTTVAYGQFSRYSAAWLDFNEDEVWKVDKLALGGQIFKDLDMDNDDLNSPTLQKTLDEIRKKDEYRAKETYAFFKDMDLCFDQIEKVMQKGKSSICFVLGNRTVKRIKVRTDDILKELGEKHNFKHEATFHREIPTKSMPLQNAPENEINMKGDTMSKESIVVWKV
jgi:site-specific DNA-methyltransferase (cytosine-N4-specific)